MAAGSLRVIQAGSEPRPHPVLAVGARVAEFGNLGQVEAVGPIGWVNNTGFSHQATVMVAAVPEQALLGRGSRLTAEAENWLVRQHMTNAADNLVMRDVARAVHVEPVRGNIGRGHRVRAIDPPFTAAERAAFLGTFDQALTRFNRGVDDLF